MSKYQTCRTVFLLLIAAPIGLIGLVFLGIYFNVKIPTKDPNWLYNYQKDFRTKLTGDSLVGGGHFFLADGRDLWIRFRVQSSPPQKPDPQAYNHCNAEDFKTIRDWFLNHAVQPRRLLGFIPLSDSFEEDRKILSQPYNLQCVMDGYLEHKPGEFPDNCGSWSIYDPETRFYYLRYACYN